MRTAQPDKHHSNAIYSLVLQVNKLLGNSVSVLTLKGVSARPDEGSFLADVSPNIVSSVRDWQALSGADPGSPAGPGKEMADLAEPPARQIII